jgi:hypothetical protein
MVPRPTLNIHQPGRWKLSFWTGEIVMPDAQADVPAIRAYYDGVGVARLNSILGEESGALW